jgi:hypothetical protein
MYRIVLLLCAVLLFSACDSGNNSEVHINDPTPEAPAPTTLASLINQYRVAQGLSAIPVSVSLTRVAEAHVADLEKNAPTGTCNLHSWSNQGNWSSCCYTGDHAAAQCMWDKPREITNGVYKGDGYENAAWNSGVMTAAGALEQWKSSPAHLDVILNRGIWANSQWKAIGAAVSAHYAVVWFGKETDPAGSP